ncbi:hypothetical protein BD414DRAFT_494685, partial [Trametes punicea]
MSTLSVALSLCFSLFCTFYISRSNRSFGRYVPVPLYLRYDHTHGPIERGGL